MFSTFSGSRGFGRSKLPSVFVNPVFTVGAGVTTPTFSPFGGAAKSYEFSGGATSFIDIPASNSWALGTGDFTIEWFSYQINLFNYQRIFTVGDYPNMEVGVSIENPGTFYYWAENNFRYSSVSASTQNTWIHYAVVRESGITKIYKNGLQLGSQFSDNFDINDNARNLIIGNTNTYDLSASFIGYITSFRWVKGIAVYYGNFTVPTSVLPAAAPENPYGGSNTRVLSPGYTKLLLTP